ncbi:MAG: hypothetical protein NC308_06210 [Clostridium sp.]|nr:hypothetical protein [Bacteroides sp.]MCM1198464.1 hypothetical protein [Clostridium sp.]
MKDMKALYYSSLMMLALSGCGMKENIPEIAKPDPADFEDVEFIQLCTYERDELTIDFRTSDGVAYGIVSNPNPASPNKSPKCASVKTDGNDGDRIYCHGLGRKFDFTANPPVFAMDIIAPSAQATVKLCLQSTDFSAPDPEIAHKMSVQAGEWERVYFDFSALGLQSNVYDRFSLYLEDSGTWYLDNISGPSDDLVDICLMQRYSGNPVFNPSYQPAWCSSHIANAGIIPPSQSPDGMWRMYLRGSGTSSIDNAYHDQIGLFTQDPDDFNPFRQWDAFPSNPVINHGTSGEFDDRNILDVAPVVGKDGVVYVYYNGNNFRGSHGLCGAYSTDGGYTFTKFDSNPLIPGYGCSDAVYHDGMYYIYYGGGSDRCRMYVTVTSDPSKAGNTYETIALGGGPSNFDSYSVNSSMVFRLSGVDKWFCTYQGSSKHYDFPDRVHIAMSEDLIHWQKVDNSKPFFSRGKAGQWDQGAIWFPEVIEHDDMLYLYYEGWGRTGYVPNRNEPYFSGRSCIGVASCSKKEFLSWCGIE